MRNAVAERLGYDPFDAAAVDRVVASVRREGDRWRASIRIEAAGVTHGERVLSSTTPACGEIASTMALTIALALDPMAGLAPSPPAPSRPAPSLPDPDDVPPGLSDTPPVAPSRAPATASPGRLALHAGAGAFGSSGALPALAGGADVFFGVASPQATLDLEGQVDLPASAGAAGAGAVRASLALGSLSPCYRVTRALRLCALLSAGVLRAEGVSVPLAAHGSSFYAAAGARAAVEVPMGPVLGLDLRVDGLAPLTSTTLGLGDIDVWTTPPLSVSVGAALVAHFP